MNWYDSIKYEIPESLDCVKKEALSKIPLIEKKKILHERLLNASRFFSNPGLSQAQLSEGNSLLIDIVSEMLTLDDEIMNKDVNIIGAIEARVIDLNVKGVTDSQINDLEEPIDSACVQFYNTNPGEQNVQIGIEDVWYFKTIKRLFNINPNNIEIL